MSAPHKRGMVALKFGCLTGRLLIPKIYSRLSTLQSGFSGKTEKLKFESTSRGLGPLTTWANCSGPCEQLFRVFMLSFLVSSKRALRGCGAAIESMWSTKMLDTEVMAVS
jgi:hypothetical protein